MISEEHGTNLRAGIDKSKPFYLRVNGADWSSTRIRETTTHSYLGDEGTDMWEGEIFGLTALTNYHCEFVRTADDGIFCSTSLITSAAPSAEQGKPQKAILLLNYTYRNAQIQLLLPRLIKLYAPHHRQLR